MKVSAKSASSESLGFVSRARRALASLLWDLSDKSPRRGRLLLEQLESRQFMAADMDMLFTAGVSTNPSANSPSVFSNSTPAEGEAAPDLVAFAKALRDSGSVTFFGASWCPFCTQQKQAFEDGGKFLPFVEVTKADHTFNARGVAEGISVMPTWEFRNTGTPVRRTGVLSLAEISTLSGIAIPTSDTPSFAAIGATTVAIGSPLNIPIDAYDPGGGPVTITVSVQDPTLLQATVLANNRSIRFDMNGYGDMVFQLFEDLAPRPASRVISLAESNFYDNLLFHRVIDGFVIQAGDGEGAADGVGGSSLPDFDDQFNRDLQHNRSGVLSYAKGGDDTNDSQFFITAGPTRSLDYNHSIFGQLVEGDDVRDAINKLGSVLDKGTNSSDKPLIDVKITSADVFTDNENSVIKLKAIGNRTGTTNVTITATDASGRTFTEVVPVSVAADSGSGSDSQPFLNDIPAPAAAPNTSPVTLQLSSIDVEGDAVTYTAASATTGVTASADAATGLVTVTPTAGFTGPARVNVGVRAASLPANTSTFDSQSVTFNFTAASTIAAPTSVDLSTVSDTGSSSTDNRTNAGSLTFTVAGVTAGNEVRLFSGTTEVGRGVATGTTITISTNNIAALGDGTYSITAKQFSGANSSPDSPALSIIYDATQPVRITGFPTAANVGTPVELNLTHAEEGNGLAYAFTSPVPTGAAINASTGVITWTPTEAQLGTQSFTLALTDAAGNVRSEVFAVTVAGAPTGGTRLELANLAGNVITSVVAGDEFLLRFYAQDLRRISDRRGVFSAFTDILFDSNLVTPVTTTPIQYGSTFSTNPDGTIETGLINELGAIANVLAATNVAEVLVATVRMRATKSGSVSFTSDPADTDGNDFALFGLDDPVDKSMIRFGRADLTIGGRFTAANDSFAVAQGAAASSINVLQNDTFASGVTGTLTVSSIGTPPSNGGTATIVNNAISYRPAATFAGTETFTYVATDNTGVTQTATVTVTVTSANNPPPTAVADAFPVVEDAAEASFNVRSNDSTTDAGETISVSAVGTSTRGSTVRLGTDGATILYRPAANFNGTDTVTYTLLDSRGASATGTVTFTVSAVNDAPPAAAITKSIFRSATANTIATIADYGTNVDGSTEVLTVALVGTGTGGGTFAVSGTSITYTPPSATFTGTATISYTTKDAGNLTTTGLITVNVLTSSPTTFDLSIADSRTAASFGSNVTANLTGTTTSGQAVTRSASLSTTSSSLRFADLAPGNYQVEVPAVPFLIGMEQPQMFSFAAVEAGGNMSRNVNIGTLNPRFISIRDFFNNSPSQAIFAAVEPGSDSLVVVGGQSATNILAPIVNLNSAADSITIRGNTSTGTASQATVPAINDRRVETRGTSGNLRLLKISLAPADVTFAAPTTPTVTSPATIAPVGEALGANRTAVQPTGGNTNLFMSSPAAAEGESPSSSQSRRLEDPTSVIAGSQSSKTNAIDDAFADVTKSLTRVSTTGDALAEDNSTPPSPDAVDQLLSANAM